MRSAATILVCLTLSNPAFAGPQEDAEAALQAWASAYGARDGDKSAALYAPDARLWGTLSAKQTIGREGVREYFHSGAQRVQTRTVNIGEHATRVYGNMAVSSGAYEFRQTMPDGSPRTIPARFSITFVNQGGQWLIVDHHSSRLPEAP